MEGNEMQGILEMPSILPSTDNFQQNLSLAIGTLLSGYTKAINRQKNRSGSLFRGKTKAKNGIIDGFITVEGKNSNLFFKPQNDYGRTCFYYIHNNSCEAGLVDKPTDWIFSSARDFAGLRSGTMCNQELAKKLLLV